MSIFSFQLIVLIFISFFLISQHRILNSIPEYLSSNIIEDIRNLLFLLPEDKIITFNNSLINITLYNTSDIYFSYDKMNINFENCLTILQKVYDLDPFFDYSNNNNNEIYKRCFFIIIKIELDRSLIRNNGSLINNNNYSLENNNYSISDNISNNTSFNNNSNNLYSYNSDINCNNNNNTNTNYNNNNITKHPTNHIEYLIFNGKNGNLLNTSYCNDLNVKISHPIVKQNGIDLNTSKKLYEEYKIDVYRTNDSFFNNFCMNYTSDKNTDLTLSQRRNIYYQNVSFCDSNCTYIEINYTSNTAVCACEVKNGIMNDALLSGADIHDHNNSFTYKDVVSIINYKIFKCYKEVFNGKRLLINVGNYASIAIIIFYTLCLIHFCKNRKRNVMYFLQRIKIKINEKKLNEEKKGINEKEENNEKDNNNNLNQEKKDSNDDYNSYILDEDKSVKFSKNKSININGIIITDISNPPLKKKKIKITSNNNYNDDNAKRLHNIEYIMKSNENITRETNTLVHNYGDIKIDTGDELLNKKNEEKNWNDIITLKRKNSKKNNHKKHIQLTSGMSSSILSSTKNNTIKSNDRKLDNSSNKTITQTNNNLDNYNNLVNLFPSFNYSVEIPISNILPSFLKPKTNLINSINSRNNYINNLKDSSTSQNSQNNFIIKRCKTKCNNAFYNNFINKYDIISEKENDNNNENCECINNNCIDISNINNNKNNFTLRRTKEIVRKKRAKERKNLKDSIKNYNRNNNLFVEFDDMKFEIAILIDNRNFCEKFICEVKENCIIIILFFRNDIMFKQIKLSLFILSCTLDYFFNAFFYSDIYLQQRYEEDELITLLIDYPKEIFSSLASQFIVKLIELLMEDKALSLFLKRIASQDKNYLKGVNYLLKKYEKRFYIYISIGYFILGITWYYSCAFCTVYQNSQMKLLYDTLESCAINIIIPFPISFLSVSFRHLAIKKLNKFLFFISNIFRIFS